MAAGGAPSMDWARRCHVFHLGGWMPRFDSELVVRTSTRALLELCVRRELVAVRPNVTVVGGARATELAWAGGTVTGVVCEDGRHERADLVADATGRASKAPEWLAAGGAPKPRTTTVKPATAYATQLFAAPPGDRPWDCMYLMPDGPGMPRGGLIYPIEGGRWGVNAFAYDGTELPDDDGMLAFFRTLVRPELAAALEGATPVGPMRRYKSTVNRRVHFEEVARWPDGFVVLGDAACGLNPVYGQGMTLAAMGAALLDREEPAASFQRRLARMQQGAWEMSTIEDLRWASTEGRRTARTRAAMAWTDRVHRAAQRDLPLYRVLADVIHLVRPSTDLLKPWATWRTVKALPRTAAPRRRSAARVVQGEGVRA